MIRKTDKCITVQGEPDKFYLSVLNPDHPIYRIHTTDTVIVLTSSFYEYALCRQLPPNCIVLEIDYSEYLTIIGTWAGGVQYKQYIDFEHIPDLYSRLIHAHLMHKTNTSPII